jgi:hypothetical protein
MRPLLKRKVKHLREGEGAVIDAVMQNYTHVFFLKRDTEVDCTKVVTHTTDTGNAAPIRKPLNWVSYALRDVMCALPATVTRLK